MPRTEPLTRRWLRRSVSIPLIAALWAVSLVLLPLLLTVALIADLPTARRGTWAKLRVVLFFVLYLSCEVCGLLVAFACWLSSGAGLAVGRRRYIAWNAAMQGIWVTVLLRGAFRIFSMSVRTEGIECTKRGPYIMFVRHGSTADTVLAGALVARPHRILLRYLLKKELLWDPCLDVVGNRLPNVFLDRSGIMREREIAAVRELATGLGESDGILIYPEGTRFTPAKRERALAKLAEAGEGALLERAERMRCVMPPRPGGSLALLDAAPGADAVFVAHTGFEGAARFSEFLGGALVRRQVEVRFWRVPAAEIPEAASERVVWLFDQWLEVDRWIAERSLAPAAR
jgi:1-acyl-sn-glycerol-3-phosphate acyltransferase